MKKYSFPKSPPEPFDFAHFCPSPESECPDPESARRVVEVPVRLPSGERATWAVPLSFYERHLKILFEGDGR